MLSAVLGLLFLVSSYDMLSLYLAIEMQSLCLYVLAAAKKDSSFSTEAGLKYFILGALSSSLFLFGSSILYGVSGTINFEDFKNLFFALQAEFGNQTNSVQSVFVKRTLIEGSLIQFALIFVFVSLLFKLAVVPFHL